MTQQTTVQTLTALHAALGEALAQLKQLDAAAQIAPVQMAAPPLQQMQQPPTQMAGALPGTPVVLPEAKPPEAIQQQQMYPQTPQAVPQQQPVQQQPASTKFTDFGQLQQAISSLGKSIGTLEPIKGLLLTFQVGKMSDLPPTSWDAFYNQAAQIVAERRQAIQQGGIQ